MVDNKPEQGPTKKQLRYLRRKANPVGYNKTIHRFPSKPYIKADKTKMAQRRAEIEAKKKQRAAFRAMKRDGLVDAKVLLRAKVVSDTMLIKAARGLVDRTIMRVVEPIQRFSDHVPGPEGRS